MRKFQSRKFWRSTFINNGFEFVEIFGNWFSIETKGINIQIKEINSKAARRMRVFETGNMGQKVVVVRRNVRTLAQLGRFATPRANQERTNPEKSISFCQN